MKLTKKIVSLFILGLLILPVAGRMVQAAETPESVSINFTGVFDDNNSSINFQSSANYGANFSLAAPSRSSYSFAYWIVNGVVRYDLEETSSIKVTSNMNLSAVYSPDGKNTVLFIDSNGEILGTYFVTSGQTVASPSLVSHVGKPGLIVKTEDTWKTPQGTVYSSELIIESNTVFILQYEVENQENTLSVTVNNGSGSGTYVYNQLVTVSANPVDFSHWEENGIEVSRLLNYSFTVVSNRTLTAVSQATPEADLPIVTMTDDLELRSGYHTYMGQFYLPSGFELVEYGFIISKNIEVITRSSTGVIVAQSNQKQPSTNEYVMSFSVGSHYTSRAYVVVKDDLDNLSTIYSVNSVTNPIIYDKHESFQNLTLSGSSYQTGSFIGDDGYSWSYTQARGDVAVNGKAIMLQNSPTANLTVTITGGIGHLQLLYTKAFSTNAAVKLSINDILVATSETSTTANSPLVFDVYNINTNGPLTIKLETSSGQLLIDDIKWTNFGDDNGFSPTFSGIDDTTSLIGDTFNPLTGVTASDFEDGNVSGNISVVVRDSENEIIESPVDFSLLPVGTYTISYSVTDSDNNTTLESKIHIITTGNSPVISGASNISISSGSEYDPLEGISVSDVEDGNITNLISVTIKDDESNTIPSIDTNTEGVYTVTYSVEDSHGNISTVEISVTVTSGISQLSTPTNLVINSSEFLTWDSVINADSYTVFVGSYVFSNQTSNSFDFAAIDLEDLSGNIRYEIAIVAIGDGLNYEDSLISSSIFYNRIRFTDLIISEYIEGSGTGNKAIEIYNGTGSNVDLTQYTLNLYSNGSATVSQSVTLTGSLSHGQVYVVHHGSITFDLSAISNKLSSSTVINFNGDDAISLMKGSSYIDIFGQIGFRPTNAWIGSVTTTPTTSTLDRTLVRNPSVFSGKTINGSFDPSLEWIAYAQDTSSFLGSHQVTLPTQNIPE